MSNGTYYSTATPRWAGVTRLPPVGGRYGFASIARSARTAMRGNNGGMFLPSSDDVGAIATSSGSAAIALWLSTIAARDPQRSEVILPAYTCYSVAAAVHQSGLKCTICDTNPDTLDFDFEMLRKLAAEKTLCIISTELFESQNDPGTALDIAQSCGARLLEDRAQGRPDALLSPLAGSAAVLSFSRGKPVAGAGGGMLLTDRALAEEIESVRAADLQSPGAGIGKLAEMLLMDILRIPGLFWLPAAIPALHVGDTEYPGSIPYGGMSDVQEAVAEQLLHRAAESSRARLRRNAHMIRQSVAENITRTQPLFAVGDEYAPSRFPVYLDRDYAQVDRERRRIAANAGIVAMYPSPISEITQVRESCTNAGQDMPGAREICARLVTVPANFSGRTTGKKVLRVLPILSTADQPGDGRANGNGYA